MPQIDVPQSQMGETLRQNIQRMGDRRRQEVEREPLGDRIARTITRFTGSMTFVYLHLVVYGLWILINIGWVPGLAPFDPTFVILASEASVEAIFLSTFVLISQNRMAAAADKRADLDLHISLLTEHELTRLADVIVRIAEKLDVAAAREADLDEVRRDVEPQTVLDAIELEQERVSG